MNSSFPDEHHEPDTTDLELALGATFQLWNDLADFTYRMYPKAKPEWKFSGSAGWHFRISDNKRVILYLLPRANFFKAAFVFGQKATDAIVDSNISQEIKTEL